MKRTVLLLTDLLLFVFVFISCRGPAAHRAMDNQMNTVDMTFQIDLDEQVYQSTTYGNPPQMAIWLQNRDNHGLRTVMVTYRMGSGDWNGKVNCRVALPYWVGFYNRHTGTSGPPMREHPAPDAVTYATPKDQLCIHTRVPEGSHWNYFIEVNVSGDFNTDFPRQSKDGRTDREGNGQPSLVYGGTLEAVKGAVSEPGVLGRMDQFEPVLILTKNTEGITTAKELLKTITVSCW
jgi:hypothetical protein